MYKRKLQALDYQAISTFSLDDEGAYRNLIVWLEDQKIRHLKIDDRKDLRDICSTEWPKAYSQYLTDMGCTLDIVNKGECLDWILGQAVRLEYGDNIEKYKKGIPTENAATTSSDKQNANPLDNLEFESAEFKAGVTSLASLLQIPPHEDHLLVLKAICYLVTERLNPTAINEAKTAEQTQKDPITIPLETMELGFGAGDYITQEAAKILRLLHIRELRELQTQINEAIVKVQRITADPKTDTRLGKVGR